MKFFKKDDTRSGKNALKGGSYAIAISVIVLAILIVINVLVNNLPSTMTSIDISASQLYSITSNTKVVANALEEDVTIYWIVQSDEEDPIIENLLAKYSSLSEHIKVEKRNPDVYPTFTEQYTSESVPNNSLIVTCGDRYRYISYSDIYTTDIDPYTYETSSYFDGEGAITSAIDYVVSDDLPKVYILEGHGERDLSDTLSERLEKENIEIDTLSLLTDEIPEDADGIMIYAPATDISEAEKEILESYIDEGGKLMVIASATEEDDLDVLYSLFEPYGLLKAQGIVIEEDTDRYAFGSPYILLPEIEDTDITSPLIEENYFVIMPIASGLTFEGATDKGDVTELLTTSDTAFSKIDGYALDTFEKEDRDIDGPFILASKIEDYDGGEIILISSGHFVDDLYNAYSSGANIDMVMNSLTELFGEREAISIRSRSLDYNYLTISESTSSLLKTLMIGVFPLAYIAIGIIVVLHRRIRHEEK